MTSFLSTLFTVILIFANVLESTNESVLGASDSNLLAITEEAEPDDSGEPAPSLPAEEPVSQAPKPEPADPPAPKPAAEPEPAPAPKDEPASPDTAPQHPIAEAIVAEGMAYVQVIGEVFSSPMLKEDGYQGRVSGIAIAAKYNEAEAEARTPDTVFVAFAAKDALAEGYMDASDASLLDRDEAIKQIGKDAVREYRSAKWPLPEAEFEPKPAGGAATETAPESSSEVSSEVSPIEETSRLIEPVISLDVRVDGGKATISARIEGIPEGVPYALQWQNDIAVSGEFVDVPGETGESVTFDVTPETTRCVWRVAVTLLEESETAMAETPPAESFSE